MPFLAYATELAQILQSISKPVLGKAIFSLSVYDLEKKPAAPAEQMRQAFEISDMLGVATKPSTVKPCKK